MKPKTLTPSTTSNKNSNYHYSTFWFRLGLVVFGGTLGTLFRYLVALVVPASASFSWPTFLVNLSGAFLLGLLIGVISRAESVVQGKSEFNSNNSPKPQTQARSIENIRLFLGTGLLGGYTTYSLLATELAQQVMAHQYFEALVYCSATVFLGLGASFLGLIAGEKLKFSTRSQAK